MFAMVLEAVTEIKIHHPITGLTIDSRKVKKETHIAIIGENHDGHDFLKEVKNKGPPRH